MNFQLIPIKCFLFFFTSEDLLLLPGIKAAVYNRVRSGPGKPGKSWNLIILIPGLESLGILVQVVEIDVGKFVCSRAV